MPRAKYNNWRNGTVLAITQAVQLANFPLAQDVAHHVHNLVGTLQPDILQAPKDNDLTAQELADRIEDLLDYLDKLVEGTEHTNALESSEAVQKSLVELQRLRDHLGRLLSKLQTIRQCQYTTKFMSQKPIHDSIQGIERQLVQAQFGILQSAIIFILAIEPQSQYRITQTAQTVQRPSASHEALQRRRSYGVLVLVVFFYFP